MFISWITNPLKNGMIWEVFFYFWKHPYRIGVWFKVPKLGVGSGELEACGDFATESTWMSRWKLGSMVSKWVITYI